MPVLHADDDNVFVREGGLVVQVRRRAMTHATLDVVERHVVGGAALPTGLLVVMEEGASVPAADVRKRQQALVKRTVTEHGAHVAVVLLATGVTGTMLRAVSRTMSIGNRRVSTFATVEDGARWLAPHVGMSALSLAQVVERARGQRG